AVLGGDSGVARLQGNERGRGCWNMIVGVCRIEIRLFLSGTVHVCGERGFFEGDVVCTQEPVMMHVSAVGVTMYDHVETRQELKKNKDKADSPRNPACPCIHS